MIIDEKEICEVANVFKILSNENRLMIVCLLLEEPSTVSKLHESLSHLSQPALSQHLSALKANKILKSKKEGLNIIYSIYDSRVHELLKTIKNIYC